MADDLDTRLAALPLLMRLAAVEGLRPAAGMMQDTGEATTTDRGQSGALRASTVAFVATDDDGDEGAIDAAYAAAVAHLDGFTGHDGKPHAESYDRAISEDVIVVGLTAMTDYASSVEQDPNKAWMGDAFTVSLGTLMDGAAAGLREVFGG